MGDSFIGLWTARFRPGTPSFPSGRTSGLAHLVQSEVTDRLVMKCGRQMRLENGRGTLSSALPIVARCFDCEGKRGA